MKQVLFLAAFVTIAVYGLYAFVNFYDKNMRVGRMRETPLVRPHEQPLLIMEEGTVPVGGGELVARTFLADNSLPPATELPKNLNEFGKKEYQAFCSHCHGDNLDGLGTVGQSFNPLPTDLTSQRVKQLSDATIFSTISYGTQRSPALAASMTVESRNAVIDYIRFRQREK